MGSSFLVSTLSRVFPWRDKKRRLLPEAEKKRLLTDEQQDIFVLLCRKRGRIMSVAMIALQLSRPAGSVYSDLLYLVQQGLADSELPALEQARVPVPMQLFRLAASFRAPDPAA